ncbi:MAG: branched-chain amino acid ABC transporter permease [Actinobacteria bacterium]|nr:MAG: branched-chain amino acid ABC transporter permease [Actinomycetota bacterium]
MSENQLPEEIQEGAAIEGAKLGIGTDEWVAQHEERITRKKGLKGIPQLVNESIPHWARWGVLLLISCVFGAFVDNQYLLRIGVNLGLFVMLAYGLNIVMGYAGLLDLGYVAFYGIGAYGYALMSSEQIGHHWSTWLTVLIIIIGTALLGFIVSLPSRRLFGDYLAIVTLFFGQVFVQLVLASDNITFPWADDYVDITAGANGIPGIDPFSFFGHKFLNIRDYYWLLLVLIVLLTIAITRINQTRIGRAWRTIREDALAAESMGVMINRLKTMAFVTGAAIAGLAGAIFAAMQTAVFVSGFDMPLMTMIYAAVILGGSGSLAGAVMGALVMSVLPEVLRVANYSEILFLAVLVLTLGSISKTLKRFAINIVGVVLIGFVVKVLLSAASIKTTPTKEWVVGPISRALSHWMYVPLDRVLWGNSVFVLLIVLIAYFTTTTPRIKIFLLPIIGYLGIFLWEVRLVTDVNTTRQLLIGAMLVVLMITRPQGFLGKARVEVL